MGNSKSVGQEAVKSFVTVTPETTIGQALLKLSSASASYCVVRSTEGEPLALATDEQLSELSSQDHSLSDSLDSLPPALPVDSDWTMGQVVDNFSSLLLGDRSLKGLVVLSNAKIEGVLPRQKVAEHAGFRFRVRGFGGGTIEGDPVNPANIYVCLQGDYEEEVDFYDRHHPPRCPTHKTLLVKKR